MLSDILRGIHDLEPIVIQKLLPDILKNLQYGLTKTDSRKLDTEKALTRLMTIESNLSEALNKARELLKTTPSKEVLALEDSLFRVSGEATLAIDEFRVITEKAAAYREIARETADHMEKTILANQ
jgi:hypothetical protein